MSEPLLPPLTDTTRLLETIMQRLTSATKPLSVDEQHNMGRALQRILTLLSSTALQPSQQSQSQRSETTGSNPNRPNTRPAHLAPYLSISAKQQQQQMTNTIGTSSFPAPQPPQLPQPPRTSQSNGSLVFPPPRTSTSNAVSTNPRGHTRSIAPGRLQQPLMKAANVMEMFPASLYLTFEAACHSVRAESGIVYMHIKGTEELQGIVLVGHGSKPPSLLKCSIGSSPAGSVLSTGCALHCEKGNQNSSAQMYFPIRSLTTYSDIVGVVQVSSKK
eukprot:PhF_6_TR32405/c0_g1_i1/m.48076